MIWKSEIFIAGNSNFIEIGPHDFLKSPIIGFVSEIEIWHSWTSSPANELISQTAVCSTESYWIDVFDLSWSTLIVFVTFGTGIKTCTFEATVFLS